MCSHGGAVQQLHIDAQHLHGQSGMPVQQRRKHVWQLSVNVRTELDTMRTAEPVCVFESAGAVCVQRRRVCDLTCLFGNVM